MFVPLRVFIYDFWSFWKEEEGRRRKKKKEEGRRRKKRKVEVETNEDSMSVSGKNRFSSWVELGRVEHVSGSL